MNFYSALQKIWGRICLELISKSHKNFLGWKPCTVVFPWDPGKTRGGGFLANGETDNLLKKIREIVCLKQKKNLEKKMFKAFNLTYKNLHHSHFSRGIGLNP